jgi:hypothetical protein
MKKCNLPLVTRPIIFLYAAAFTSCLASYAHAAEGEKDWRITPRIGFSPSTGFLGVEAQRGNYALAAGQIEIPVIFTKETVKVTTTAFRYYFKGLNDSWSASFFNWHASEGNAVGLSAEYRWRFGSQSDITTGLSIGYGNKTNKSAVIPSISYGYSF